MKKADICALLRSLPLFAGVDDAQLGALVNDSAEISSFSPGEEIYSPKNKEKTLGVILSGAASVFSADENNTVLLRILEKGDTFGVATLFARQDEFVSQIVAKKVCRVLFLRETAVASLIRDDAAFRMNYIRFLSDRICFLNTKITCFTAGSPERKLAFFLLSFADGQADTYTVSTSANSLSEMLNVGRASLYRAFEKLEAEGLIARDGKRITVTDKNILKQRFG